MSPKKAEVNSNPSSGSDSKIGDRVRIINPASFTFYGRMGTVVHLNKEDRDWDLYVHIDDGMTFGFYFREVETVD